MQVIKHIGVTCIDHGNPKSKRKTRLKIDASSCAITAVRHIRNQKTRSADFRNDSVIYFLKILLTVCSIWFEPGSLYCRNNPLIACHFRFLLEPHRDKCLCRIDTC